MAEYIEREAAIALASGGCAPSNVAKEIAQLPAADVAPVVHAHYIINEDGDPRCSACGAKYIDSTKRYCPDCGARMDGADTWEERDD